MMFVYLLSTEGKQALIDLATGVASCDGIFDKNEQGLVEALKLEAALEKYDAIEIEPNKINRVLSQNELKAIYFELLGVALADGDLSEYELNYMSQFAESAGLSKDFQEKVLNWVDVYRNHISIAFTMINES
jgi:tellurite resistance protein